MANTKEIIYDVGKPKITTSTGDQPEPLWTADDTQILHMFDAPPTNKPHPIMVVL